MVVRFSGGLGNQMFQYAFFRSLVKKYPESKVECDLGDFERFCHHNGYELERIFGIKVPECSRKETERHKIKMTIPYRLLRKLGFKKVGYPKRIMDAEKGYDAELVNGIRDDDFLWGYWQDEHYFAHIRNEILDAFVFPPLQDERNQKCADAIGAVNSVSIHVRRGDYLETQGEYVDLCSTHYYEKAIEYVKLHVESPVFFVFSDDIQWCTDHLGLSEECSCYVNWNRGLNSYIDMHLMSLCKFNVIANSTFSWWGAWLNQNKCKQVIAPNRFRRGLEQYNNSIVCKDWVMIEV